MRTRLTELLGIEVPIIQAPMAGSSGPDLAVAVAEAGGLGSLACAGLPPEMVVEQLESIRARTQRPINLNFFCHVAPSASAEQMAGWNDALAAYFAELDLSPPPATADPSARPGVTPFDEPMCAVVEELRPSVVSFHFGLPSGDLVERVRATGATILSSATSVAEAKWLEAHGCDVVIAQGFEAGGHRGMFLTDDVSTQTGTMALVPQVVDAVDVPVVAAGGIADGRGFAAARMLGADGVQIGTAFLLCPEAATAPLHRAALAASVGDETALTNVFTGRPARGIVTRVMREVGPMSTKAPPFPMALAVVGPLRARAEPTGSTDFSSLWSGQAGALAYEVAAGELVRRVNADAESLLP